MSSRTDRFKSFLAAERAAAIKDSAGDSIALASIGRMADGVRVSATLPTEDQIVAAQTTLRGYTDAFIAMLPAWCRITAVPAWFTRRAWSVTSAGLVQEVDVVDSKLWLKIQNAVIFACARGEYPVRDGKFDAPMPVNMARLFVLIKVGNIRLVLRAAAGLMQDARRVGKSSGIDTNTRLLSDGTLDLGCGNLMDAASVKIALTAADLTAAASKESIARDKAVLAEGSAAYAKALDTLDRAITRRVIAQVAFDRAWTAKHAVTDDSAVSDAELDAAILMDAAPPSPAATKVKPAKVKPAKVKPPKAVVSESVKESVASMDAVADAAPIVESAS